MSLPNVGVLRSLQELSAAAARAIASELRAVLADAERATLALSGGKTPKELYLLLARELEALPCERLHFFWCDERYLPHDDPESNFKMACESLLKRVPPANVHPMPTDLADPNEAARAYQRLLEAHFNGLPRFDLVILGLGADGHTASLFPGAPTLAERERLVITSLAPHGPKKRLTLTLSVLCNAASLHFLAAGLEKRQALARAWAEPSTTCPASLVRPTNGTLHWWVDEAAAGG